jgi:transposase
VRALPRAVVDFQSQVTFRGMTYSADLRWRAIELITLDGLTLDTVASILGVSVSAIQDWLELYYQTGDVVNHVPRAPRSDTVLDEADLDFINQTAQEQPWLTISEMIGIFTAARGLRRGKPVGYDTMLRAFHVRELALLQPGA